MKRYRQGFSFFPKFLSAVKCLLRNNRAVASCNVIHFPFSVIALLLPRERIGSIAFLQQRISCVPLIQKDIINGLAVPNSAQHLILVKAGRYFSGIATIQIFIKNPTNRRSFLFINFQLSGNHTESDWRIVGIKCSLLHAALVAPLPIAGD